MSYSQASFKTRQQKEEARKKGFIHGYFGKVQRGRPPTKLNKAKLPMNATVSALNQVAATAKAKAKESKYLNWKSESNFDVLKAAVVDNLGRNENQSEEDVATLHGIPRATLQRHTARFLKVAYEGGVPIDALTLGMVFPLERGTGIALLDDDQVSLLSSAIIHRDECNNGMSRNEAIQLVMELSQCGCPKKAANHFDYLVRKRRLVGVKNFGRTVKAQATTTKRSQIHVEQQLRWHTTVDEALQEQRRLNHPIAAFELCQDHFFGNMDETCLMANADGAVRVLASAGKKKTEKNSNDSRVSITSLRVGMASGDQGPFTFLARGNRFDRPSVKKVIKERCPSGSNVHMSPSAYLTDEVYLQLVLDLCRGIRQMPVIKEHPDWWVILSLDGFGSHVNVNAAHEIFHNHRIMVIKEEGDTSHVNQAYDQFVAKQVSSFEDCCAVALILVLCV